MLISVHPRLPAVAGGKLARAIRASPWTPLAGKAALALAGFVLLALVGSGAVAGWLPRGAAPAPPAASAAPPPSSSASAPEPVASGAADAGSGAEEPEAPEAEDAGAVDGGASPGLTPDGKVILNLATEQDLRHLPGIGPAKAKGILALRARLGKLKRPEDLLRVKGIGRKRLARIRPLVVMDG